MKKLLNIGFGIRTIYESYKNVNISTRLKYGLAQLENSYDMKHVSLEPQGFIGTIKNNLKIVKDFDIVFIAYLYISPFMFIAFLRRIGLFRKRRIIGISHFTLDGGISHFEKIRNRLVYNTFDTILFHSQKNMEESIDLGLVKREKAALLFWGDDLDYIDRFLNPKLGDFFLSTGREQRDFMKLISVFSKTDAKIELYTNRVHYSTDNGYLSDLQGTSPNIKIEFVEKSIDTTVSMAKRCSECLCVVIPLLPNEVHYCVGLTSIVEAMAMGKPIISSPNPYSPIDIEKEGIGFVVDDEQSWLNAIDYITNHPYEVREMGLRARQLAERRFNINECAKQLDNLFKAANV